MCIFGLLDKNKDMNNTFEEAILREHLTENGYNDGDIEEYIRENGVEKPYEAIMKRARINGMKQKIRNSLRAFIIGDALGVPFESQKAGTFECTGFVGGGIHQEEAGTWSDDTSIMLCLLDALTKGKDVDDAVELLKENLKKWYYEGEFTVDGTFDVGRQTAASIGCEFRNGLTDRMGNGALFYAPIAYYYLNKEFSQKDFEVFCKLTHNNENCFKYGWKFGQILKDCIFGKLKVELGRRYQNNGDVINTFNIVWDHFFGSHYKLKDASLLDCLCHIVNYGGDTDTNAALLGLLLGAENKKKVDEKDWQQIRKHEFADKIINDFVDKVFEFEEREE